MARTTTTTTTTDATEGFTAQERAAMKERAAEVRAQARRGGKAAKAAEQEAEVLAKIAEMPDADRVLAERVHALVRTHAPELAPRTWYGMPAYARGDKVLCFFQGADKFTARYAALGFNDVATLDDGPMWPTAFALTEITPAVEEQVVDLLRRAAG